MKPKEIKAKLILKDVLLSEIASEAGCSVSQVSRCISGNGIYKHVRGIIARKLDKEVHEIFNKNHPAPKHKPVTV